ncbi:MAG TPA: DUF4168 domain-containing protein [candidate division Zixibacteria bacterium]|nr:DUF4168 domain-containing protein [candidate division Zixibacteria bacterium]
MGIMPGAAVAAIFTFFLFSVPCVGLAAEESEKPQASVSDNELRVFARVYVEVEKIRRTYEPRLKDARNTEEAKKIQDEAASQMQRALSRGGLTAEEYNRIFAIARADEGLRNKLLNMISEERGKS